MGMCRFTMSSTLLYCVPVAERTVKGTVLRRARQAEYRHGKHAAESPYKTPQPPDTASRSPLSNEPSGDKHPTPHSLLQSPRSRIGMTGTSETGSSEGSFYDRKPSVEFKRPTPDWGYLAQINEKFKTVLTWDVERIVGEPAHKAMFQCTPGEPSSVSMCRGSQLTLGRSMPQITLASWKSVSICPYVWVMLF